MELREQKKAFAQELRRQTAQSQAFLYYRVFRPDNTESMSWYPRLRSPPRMASAITKGHDSGTRKRSSKQLFGLPAATPN